MAARLACISLVLLSALYAPAYAAGNTLALFRAVRISDSTIALSFVTSQPSIGELSYTGSSDQHVTLTDADPQTDHLFTVENLDPKKAYSFSLSAGRSSTYIVLLAPNDIGGPGESMRPEVKEKSADGSLTIVQDAASSSPMSPSTVPLGLGIALVSGGCVGWFLYSRQRKNGASTSSSF